MFDKNFVSREGAKMNINQYLANCSDDYLDSERDSSEELLLAELTGSEGGEVFYDGLIDRDTGLGHVVRSLRMPHLDRGNLSGGDLDDDWYQAEVVGEEAVGGDNPTPDQNVTEGLLQSMGIASVDGRPVATVRNFSGRDQRRWELNPDSAEDHQANYGEDDS
jgi:hypothetical protein